MREELSLKYAKQQVKRNMWKYDITDNVFNSYVNYYLRADEVQSLIDYAKKLCSYKYDRSNITVENITNY